MTPTDQVKFIRTVCQKTGTDGKLLPIRSWRLQQGTVTVAFGERRTEQQALTAAQAAERNQVEVL